MDKITNNFKRYGFTDRMRSLCRIEFGEDGSCPIDQTPAKEFNIDPTTGRPYSDISLIMRAQSNLQQKQMLAELQEFKSEFLPKDISDEDAVKFQRPRLCQSPSELAQFQEAVTSYNLEQAEKARNEAERQQLLAELHATEPATESTETKSE